MEALETHPRVDGADLRTHDHALLALAAALQRRGYQFTCVTPDTHALVVARRGADDDRDLRDVFGWSLPFDEKRLPPDIAALLRQANALPGERRKKSLVRYSSFDRTLVVHSAWPTVAADAVFFGPDTYRFAALIERTLNATPKHAPRTVVDLGCGTGAGGILAARLLQLDGRAQVLFTDVNPLALRYARINALHAGVARFECLHSDVLQAVCDPIDLVLANPPYLLDPQQRSYRHGGGALGTGLSLRIVEESLQRLTPGGQLILYTASPIVDGVDTLQQQLAPLLARGAARGSITHRYQEIDPDVFGAELEHPAYSKVERIAVVGLTLQVSD